jgi:hypothetical protein
VGSNHRTDVTKDERDIALKTRESINEGTDVFGITVHDGQAFKGSSFGSESSEMLH